MLVIHQFLRLALSAFDLLAVATATGFKSRATLHLENLAPSKITTLLVAAGEQEDLRPIFAAVRLLQRTGRPRESPSSNQRKSANTIATGNRNT